MVRKKTSDMHENEKTKDNITFDSSRKLQLKLHLTPRRAPSSKRRERGEKGKKLNKLLNDGPNESLCRIEHSSCNLRSVTQKTFKEKFGSNSQFQKETKTDETDLSSWGKWPKVGVNNTALPIVDNQTSRSNFLEKKNNFQAVLTELKSRVRKNGKEIEMDIMVLDESKSSRPENRTCRGNFMEKKNNFQAVLTELKSRVRKSNRESEVELAGPNEWKSDDVPPEVGIILEESASERGIGRKGKNNSFYAVGCAMDAGSSDHAGSWLSKAGKIHRQAGIEGPNRKTPFQGNVGRGGFFSSKLGSGIPLFSGGENAEVHRGVGSGAGRQQLSTRNMRDRLQFKRRGVNSPMRRTKSWSSLQVQRDILMERDVPSLSQEWVGESILVREIEKLKSCLADAERDLKKMQEKAENNRTKMRAELDRLGRLYVSMTEDQERRYQSILEVFNENHTILGYVESNFDYLVSALSHQNQTFLQIYLQEVLRFIADRSMSSLFWAVKTGSRLYVWLCRERYE